MNDVAENRRSEELLMVAVRELKGFQHRVFLGRACRDLCDESPRKAEARFGWCRETVAKCLRELEKRNSMTRPTLLEDDLPLNTKIRNWPSTSD